MATVISLQKLSMDPIPVPANKSVSVVLVNMPFASTHYPSLSLSTLKPQIAQYGHAVTVKNYNLLFAHMIGLDGYETLAGGSSGLLCEQIFAQLVYPDRSNHSEFIRFIERYTSIDQFNSLVDIADQFLQCCCAELLSCNTDLIGFTTTFYQKMASVALSIRLKRIESNTPIIFGGAACEMPMGIALMQEYQALDYVLHGEADNSFPAFVNALSSGQSVTSTPGLCYRDTDDEGNVVRQSKTLASTINLNTISTPDYQDYKQQVKDYDFGDAFQWQYSFESSRGCWWGQKHHCTFCGLNGQQMQFRSKSASHVIEQLSAIALEAPDAQIQFSDNILNYKFVDDLIPTLGSIGNLRYFFEVKANLKQAQVHSLAANRVLEVQPGIERLCTNTLRLMNKGTSSRQNIQVLRWCADHGIKAIWNILYGFAGELPEDVIKEVKLYKQLFHLPPPDSCAPIRIDRYSPNYTRATALGYSIAGPSQAEQFMHFGSTRIKELAYHFDYEYIDAVHYQSPLSDAWRLLARTVEEWQQQYRPRALIARYQAKEVVIRDTRNDQCCEWLLKGVNAQLYQSLHKFRKRSELCRIFDGGNLALEALKERRLLIELDDQVMAAAVGCACDLDTQHAHNKVCNAQQNHSLVVDR